MRPTRGWSIAMAAAGLLAGAVASGCDSDAGGFPWGGGGPGNGGGPGGGADAAPGVDSAPGTVDATIGPDAFPGITGRICNITDLRLPSVCSGPFEPRDIDVLDLESTAQTLSTAGGAFTLPIDGGDAATLLVGTAVPDWKHTVLPIALADGVASGVVVPLARTATWETIVTAAGGVDPRGDAAVLVYVRDAAGPVQNAIVTPPAGTFQPVFYDAGGPAEWRTTNGTGTTGVALVLTVPASQSTVTLVVEAPGRAAATLAGVPVLPDAVTFVTARL